MTKIIYFDIDGTLRSEMNKVSPKTKYAIEQCSKKGIICVICTGRNPGSIQEDIKELPMSGVISGGGCFVKYKNKILSEEYFQRDVVKKIIDVCFENKIAVSLESKTNIYMNKPAAEFYKNDFAKKIKHYNLQLQNEIYKDHKICFQENMQAFEKENPNIHKICVIGQYGFINWLSIEMKEKISVVQMRQWENSWYLELLPKGCNKGKAIHDLNQQLNIDRVDTMCFGDSENDIDMMKESEIAIAMNNNVLKSVASSICESVEDDGIYKELVRRKIIQPEEK